MAANSSSYAVLPNDELAPAADAAPPERRTNGSTGGGAHAPAYAKPLTNATNGYASDAAGDDDSDVRPLLAGSDSAAPAQLHHLSHHHGPDGTSSSAGGGTGCHPAQQRQQYHPHLHPALPLGAWGVSGGGGGGGEGASEGGGRRGSVMGGGGVSPDAEAAFGEEGAGRSSKAWRPRPRRRGLVSDIMWVLRIPTFQAIVLQGIVGCFPWQAVVFLTLWLQLQGFPSNIASAVTATFGAGVALVSFGLPP
jgi:hypothetical protein